MATAVQINQIGAVLELRRDIGDEMLAVAYFRMKSEGLLATVFYDCYPAIGLRDFLEWHQKIIYLGCFARRLDPILDKGPELAGLGWINKQSEVNGFRRGEVGMVFWKEWRNHHRPHIPTEFCEQLLDFCFDKDGANLDIVYGASPVFNRASVRFGESIGFKVEGTISGLAAWYGKPCPAVVMSLSREEWLQRKG